MTRGLEQRLYKDCKNIYRGKKNLVEENERGKSILQKVFQKVLKKVEFKLATAMFIPMKIKKSLFNR